MVAAQLQVQPARRRSAPYVLGEHGIDRHYYELCRVLELRNTLRAGDVWVSGLRQFKDFEDYLLPAGAFDALASARSCLLQFQQTSNLPSTYYVARMFSVARSGW
jgi:hypothetical protein